MGALAALAAGALAFAFFAWPRGALTFDSAGLAHVRGPSFGGAGVRVSVRSAEGAVIPVILRPDGGLWPTRRVAPGTRMFVEVVFRRPAWVGWVAGRTQRLRLDLTAPSARLEQRWLRVRAGAPVRVSFDRAVREVEVVGSGAPRLRVLPRQMRTVVLGRLGEAGSVGVSAVTRTWERLPPATSVTWFPPGGAAKLLVAPKPGSGREGVVIVDTPSGTRGDEDRFLGRCLDTIQRGTPYVRFERIALNVISTNSKLVRLLQLADVVTSCTLAYIGGEPQWSLPVFEQIKTILRSDYGRLGGCGVKIHPDLRYRNLYHWLLGDTHFVRYQSGVPLPLANYPYAQSPDEP